MRLLPRGLKPPRYSEGLKPSTRESATAGTNVYKKAGKVVMTTKAAISADGKTMTLTSTGTNPKGQAIHNVQIYTK